MVMVNSESKCDGDGNGNGDGDGDDNGGGYGLQWPIVTTSRVTTVKTHCLDAGYGDKTSDGLENGQMS